MNRIDCLKALIKELQSQELDEIVKYIGTGNPNADILIIGKESSFDDKASEQYKVELEGNFKAWEHSDFHQEKVPDFNSWEDYKPLYPFKGQRYKIDNGSNQGTSRTWYTYQKLINKIYKTPNNKDIDFHEKAFITEVNSSPSKMTKNADISSIMDRKSNIITSEFFQSFPVVILSGVGYFRISSEVNEIEEIFNVNYSEKKIANECKSQPYWIHHNNSSQHNKLLVNTHQLSIGIADVLLDEVAELVTCFLNDQNRNEVISEHSSFR